MENPVVVDESIDGGGLESIFQKTAAELAKLHSLSHNKKIAFDAGIKNAYERAYEWIQLQLQDGKSITAADMSAYLQNKLSDSMLNTLQLLEQMATAPQQTGALNEMNDNASDSPSQEQEMETLS